MTGVQTCALPICNSEDLTSTLYGASSRLRDPGEPGQAARIMLDKSREQTAAVLEKVNAFFAKDFADYRAKVEAVEFSLFGEREPVRME